MNKFTYIVLLVASCFATLEANAQTLSPNVMPTQGGYFSAGVGSLSWTLGETFTPTLTAGSNILSQGEQQPEVDIMSVSVTGTSFCTGGAVSISFTAHGIIGATNVFTAELSNASGSFASPVAIGTLTGNASGTINGTIPSNTPSGTGYRIRVKSSLPVFTSKANTSNLTVATCTVTWISNGGAGQDEHWNNPLNWNMGGVTYPNSSTVDVEIPKTSTPPDITGATYSVRKVTIEQGVRMSINNQGITPGVLNVYGDWQVDDIPSFTIADVYGSGKLILAGSSQQTLSGVGSFERLRVNNSTSGSAVVLAANADFSIVEVLELQDGDLEASASGSKLTFKSAGHNQIATLNDFSFGAGHGKLIGDHMYVERKYKTNTTGNSFGQHMMGSSVNGTNMVGQFGGGSGTPGYVVAATSCYFDVLASGSPYGPVMAYDETHGSNCSSEAWLAVTSGNMPEGKGYSVALNNSGLLTINGSIHQDDQYQLTTLKNSNWSNIGYYQHTPPMIGLSVSSGWHLMSNPYQAYLNIDGHNTANPHFDNQVQVWHPAVDGSDPYAGTYQPLLSGSNAIIAPLQAFMVHKTSKAVYEAAHGAGTYVTNSTYNLNKTDLIADVQSNFHRQANDQQLEVYATNVTTGKLDVTTVAFNTDAKSEFDMVYDANKSTGNPDRHTLYTNLPGGDEMAINVNHDMIQSPNIPMGMRPGMDGNYKFNVTGINTFDPTSYVYLEDKATSQWIDMRQNNEYAFTMSIWENANRFVLHFTPPVQLSATDAACNTQGSIHITQPGMAVWNYAVNDNNGNVIGSGTVNQNAPAAIAAVPGTYTITLRDNNGYTVVKNISVSGATTANGTFTASATTVQANEPVTFSTTEPASTTTWEFSDGTIITGVSNPIYSFNTPGTYTVTLTITNNNGCTATTTQTITVTAATGIANITNSNISIWSNLNKVNVDFSKVKNVDATIEIYNTIGQQLSSDKMHIAGIYSKEITQMEAAYVLVKVKTENGTMTKKVFITNIK